MSKRTDADNYVIKNTEMISNSFEKVEASSIMKLVLSRVESLQ